MHQMFLKDYPDLAVKVKYNFYYKYCKENFDYTFGRPQVDVCSQCESLNAKIRDPALSESAKRGAAGELVLHKRRAKKCYTELNTAKENKDDDTVVLCFDYMSNLPLPNIPVQEIFYMCQLRERLGSLRMSDGAAGQNNNHTVVRFLMNLCDRGKPSSYKKTVNSDETLRRGIHKDDRISFKISSYKHFIFRHRLPGKVEAKTFINGLFSSMFTFRKTNQSPDLPTNKAYPTGKVPINKKKIDDLKKLSEYTTDYSDFYNIILSWPISTQEEGMHDSEYEEQ
ncbi:hypothetical protein QTP88_000753 [Uroleucon formosanum]